MSTDPISRLEVVRREVDRVFGDGYAAAHPDVVTAVVQSAASDWAAARLAVAIERVAEALLVEEETQRIVPARAPRAATRPPRRRAVR
jgi:type IV pilus biogenesis protein CpaD/CtpE